jgi:hypothetical protein
VDQLGELLDLAKPIKHEITAEPEAPEALSVIAVNPNTAGAGQKGLPVLIMGTGFKPGATIAFAGNPDDGGVAAPVITGVAAFSTKNLLVATLDIPAAAAKTGPWFYDVTVTNPGGQPPATLTKGFKVTNS